MSTETITHTLYQFNELGDEARQRAIGTLWGINVDYGWWEHTCDTIKDAGECLGIACTVSNFDLDRGAHVGLCGGYSYRKNWRAALRKNFVDDTLAALVKIGEELQSAQRRAFYCASIDLRPVRHGTAYTVYSKFVAYVTGDLTDALRSFEHWALTLLRREYEYLTSEEAIIEAIEANEYEFDENGNLA